MRVSVFAAVLSLTVATALAQNQAPPRCDAPEHRQFDFWVGEWRVESPEGKHLGTNTISRDLANCVLVESWRGASGFAGKSFNIWDRSTGQWHQTWVDVAGNLLLLDGGWTGSAMRMEGKGKRRDGTPVRNRITWTPLDREGCRGCVRQFWESAAEGEEWKPVFDGLYRPAAER